MYVSGRRFLEEVSQVPILLIVGPNGSGKTLLAGAVLHEHLKAHEDHQVVSVVDRDHPRVQEMRDVKDLLQSTNRRTYELDELSVHGFDARDRMPKRLRRHMMQYRKRKQFFLGTAPSLSFVEKTLREIAFTCVDARGWSKKRVPGTPWKSPRFIHLRSYDMQGVSRLPDDTGRRPKPGIWTVVRLEWLLERTLPYDTHQEVEPLRGVDRIGACMICGGNPPGAPRCKCDDLARVPAPRKTKSVPEERAPEGPPTEDWFEEEVHEHEFF